MSRRSSNPQPRQAEYRQVVLGEPGDDSITVRIRRYRGSRHVRLSIDDVTQEIVASVPQRFAARRLDPIVRERRAWIEEVLARSRAHARATEVDVEAGGPIRLLGTDVPTLVRRDPARRRSRADFEDGVLVLDLPSDADAHDALLEWYRDEARRLFEGRTHLWASTFGVEYGRISIREQRTRWGSCTHRGDLSFNWRLLLAPGWVVDSIVVHELCHIDELNHAPRFWELLDERYPRHVEASEWLREHGATLRVTRPSGSTPPDGTPTDPTDGAEDAPNLAMRPRGRHRAVRSWTRPSTQQLELW